MIRSWKKKLSITISAVMLMAMLLPVISYAAANAGFYYSDTWKEFVGSIYTADPDSVTVAVYDENDDFRILSEKSDRRQLNGFDQNNVPYYSMSFVDIDTDYIPTRLVITEGTTVIETVYTSPGRFNYFNDEVELGAYRIQGSEYFSGKLGGSKLQPNDTLFTFTPEFEDLDYIKLSLPSNYLANKVSLFNPTNTVGSDFELVDNTVSSSVYAKSIIPDQQYNIETHEYEDVFDSFLLQFEEPLLKNHTYQIKLSSTSQGNEITLAGAGSNYYSSISAGKYISYQFEEETRHFFQEQNQKAFFNLTLSSPSTGIIITSPITPVIPDTQAVTASDLGNASDGKVSLKLDEGTTKLQLPLNASELIGDNQLSVEGDGFSFLISASELDKLTAELSEEQLKDSKLLLNLVKGTKTDTAAAIKASNPSKNTAISSAGSTISLTLSVVTADDETIDLGAVSTSFKVIMEVSGTANTDLVGVYQLMADESLKYIGGKLNENGQLEAEIGGNGTYAVLEYDKSYVDVSSDFWALDKIKRLSAQHIFEGDNAGNFNPQGNMTRAEFAKVIGLISGVSEDASGASSSFSDVDGDAWYAGYVEAALNAGLMSGMGDGSFNPSGEISRQQMAVILGRVLEMKGVTSDSSSDASSFTDQDNIAVWAQQYLDLVVQQGLISGRPDGSFDPEASLTRAEAAKVLALLQSL
ncbi:S-layer homology domain-containing protein [Paenibacillus sp. HB172176]|uniref:S-layer homology domain-containing protein n=1 Tax=Paenibacillus sp. HB172176 TaxID=2493690 RepID=UPI00143A5019|nr:S-layer homology domain-containing protein [Paenibacillus sp. HB172176]